MARERRTEAWIRGGVIGIAIGLVVVSLAACGDDDGDAAATTTTTSAATTTTTAATTTTVATTTSTTSTTTTIATTTAPAGVMVDVHFSTGDGSDCSMVAAFRRDVGGADPIQAAFEELVGGPTAAEVEAGAGSAFSPDTADVVQAVSLDDGLLVIDFADLRPLIPNSSTSCGSEALLAQLNGTAFQFATVDRVRYRIAGSCDDFANWLQRDCFDADRTGRQLDVPTNERASGSGCTPGPGDDLPDGRWFGFVADARADAVSFDLACWFTGAAAVAAAAEDGEESPPPNDFHVRNDSDRLRTLTVDSSSEVAWLPDPGDPESLQVVGYPAWLIERTDRAFLPGVWLEVAGGRVVSIEEQYVP